MNKEALIKEFQFKAIRSSGAGGQHVNKTSSKIELTFDLDNSKVFTESEKLRLQEKLASRLTNENILILFCEETRSQHKNKEIAIKKCIDLLAENLKKPKKRKPTSPSKAVVKKNIEKSKLHSQKKKLRQKPNI